MSSLIEVDHEVMRTQFGRQSFAVRHNLTDHPLLAIERLAQLADSLPADQAEHTDSDAPSILPEGGKQDPRMGAGDVVRGNRDERQVDGAEARPHRSGVRGDDRADPQ